MKRLIGWNVLTAVALVALAAGVTPASAQEQGAGDRIIIMVPDLAPRQGANDNFGEDVAEELRDLIDELHTHQTVSGRDLNRARKEYDLDTEDLYDCIRARQLAMRKSWGLVLCGEYTELGDRQVQVNAKFVGAQDGSEFAVPQFQISERDQEGAARKILETFDLWQTQLRHTLFCQQYMGSQQWDRALENCEQALAINESSRSALYMKAYILEKQQDYDGALAVLDQLLENDPIDQDALKLAGIAATRAEMREKARGYFDRYMELNPGDVGVRLTVATEINNAGDPAAAMRFAQEGLEVEPDNMTLLTYIGHFAAQAAGQAEAAMARQNQGQAEPGEETVDPTVITEYYQTAADAYQAVFESEGTETDPQILERLIISLFKLGNYDEAVTLGEQVIASIEQLPEEAPAGAGDSVTVVTRDQRAGIWDAYSRALQEAGQVEEALAAIEKAEEMGRSSPATMQRKAMLQLQAGNQNAAVAALNQGVEEGVMEATAAFNTIFAHAFNNEYKQGRLNTAYQLLDAAGPLAQTERDRLTRNFWRGYILFEQAKAAHEPMTAASAQRAKPLFERALELFRAASGYEQYHASANVPQLIDAATRFIEIEEALIKRGR